MLYVEGVVGDDMDVLPEEVAAAEKKELEKKEAHVGAA
jgi:hypothetical protein